MGLQTLWRWENKMAPVEDEDMSLFRTLESLHIHALEKYTGRQCCAL